MMSWLLGSYAPRTDSEPGASCFSGLAHASERLKRGGPTGRRQAGTGHTDRELGEEGERERGESRQGRRRGRGERAEPGRGERAEGKRKRCDRRGESGAR